MSVQRAVHIARDRSKFLALFFASLVLCFSADSAHAVGTVFSEDFETGIGAWSADNGVWQVGMPTAGPANCVSGIGTQCAGTNLGGNYPASTDSRFISPAVVLPSVSANEELHLRFQQWFSYSTGDFGQVQIAVWNAATSTWGDWINAGVPVADSSPDWSIKDVELTDYAGETVRIAFLHSADSSGITVSSGWYIDNVQIVSLIPAFTGSFESGWDDWSADRGVWQVGTPTGGPGACAVSDQCAGTILDGNYPASTDSRLVSASLTLPNTAGNEVHLRFQQWFSYSTGDFGQVQISVWNAATSTWGDWINAGTTVADSSPGWSLKDVELTDYAGETVRIAFFHSADSSGITVNGGWYIDNVRIVLVTPAFTGSFESGWGDWSADRGVWQVGTPTAGPGTCVAGSLCAGTILDGNYPASTDSRLVSASLTLPNTIGNEVHLRFQEWFTYSTGDFGQVQLSVWDAGRSTWGDWIDADIPVADSSPGWSIKDVDLTAYAGETVRIAFYHSADSSGITVSSGWYIDDVQIVSLAPAFTGSFDSGWGPWSADRGVWQVGTPTAGPASCATGSRCAGTILDGNYPASTDSRLVSATVTLPACPSGAGVHMRFQQWFSYSTGDFGQIQVSVWDTATSSWGSWENVGQAVTDTSAGWSTGDAVLTPYAGETVRIAFFHSADSSGITVSSGWYVDDISIVADCDADFVLDNLDNCTKVANTNQLDTDGDGIGNMCDCDFNQDNFCGGPDFTLFIGCFNAATGSNAGCKAADMNGDGFVGGPDFSLFIGGFNGAPGPSAQ